MLRSYVVQPGDTLVSIAEKFYGDPKAFTDIYRENEDVILDPYDLQPGIELYIPPSAETIHKQVHEHEAGARDRKQVHEHEAGKRDRD